MIYKKQKCEVCPDAILTVITWVSDGPLEADEIHLRIHNWKLIDNKWACDKHPVSS